MTVLTVEEKADKRVYLTVGEGKHLCYTLSYMTRSVKNGLKKSATNRKEYKEQYSQYKIMRDGLIDQIKDFKDAPESNTIEITIKHENIEMLNDFVRQQIHLFDNLVKEQNDDLNKNIHDHIIPLQTIAYKIQ